MPFGFNNAPGTFQRAIDVILSTARWHYAFLYLYYIVVLSHYPQRHIEHVRSVLALEERKINLESEQVRIILGDHRLPSSNHTARNVIGLHALQVGHRRSPVTYERDVVTVLSRSIHVFERLVPNFACLVSPINKKLRKFQPLT